MLLDKIKEARLDDLYRDGDKIDFSLPLSERLKLVMNVGARCKDAWNQSSASENGFSSSGLDEFLYAMSVFKNVNPHIKYIKPSYAYYVMRRLGYRKDK